jgi:hypothetical protein
MFNPSRPHPPQAAQQPPEVRAAAEEHAATVTAGAELLDVALAEADARSAPARAELRSSLEELRARLAREERALAEAEEAARRDLREALRDWYERSGERARAQIDAAEAFAIGRELRDVTANRDVVLQTTHPSMHKDIAGAFDVRIEALTARAEALGAPIPEEDEDSPPVLAGVAWAQPGRAALVAVVLPLEPGALREGVAEAVRELAREMGGDGGVRREGGGDEPLRLVAPVSPAAASGRRDVASRLSELVTRRLEGADGWPAGARAAVQAVDGDRVEALGELLPVEPVG